MVCMSLAIFTNIKAWKSGGLFTVTWNEQKNEFKGTNLEVSGVSGDILKNHKHTELESVHKTSAQRRKHASLTEILMSSYSELIF